MSTEDKSQPRRPAREGSPDEGIRVAVRLYGSGKLLLTETLTVPHEALETLLEETVQRHRRIVTAHRLHMIELELLDEHASERFFRFGTDPRAMVQPISIKL